MESEGIIARLVEKGFLVSPELVNLLKGNEADLFLDYLSENFKENKPLILDKNIYERFVAATTTTPEPSTDAGTQAETQQDNSSTAVALVAQVLRPVLRRESVETKVKVKKNYVHANRKIDINDWVAYYFDRYNRLRDILQNRDELQGTIAIGRALKADGRQKVSVIGMVRNIQKTLRGSYVLELEDPTGLVKVMLRSPEALRKAEELVFDEVIGIVGTKSGDLLYADDVYFPDIPERPIKKAEDEVYAVFLSDIHVGSNMFLPKEFGQTIDWLKGKIGNDKQRELAQKIKYVFVTGDLVDGVGIYPGQENELLIKDIYDQYEEFARYMAQIPEDVHIMVAPGNHDALRLEEPQPALYKELAKSLYGISNAVMVSNPALVNIHNVGNFPGIDVLQYHGYSFDYFVSNNPVLRKYGYDGMDKVHEFLLRKRHLAPSHGSTLINPMASDYLIIDKLPDVIATGHVHKAKVGRYKNIATVSSSCYQDRTAFQEKVGHHPEPGRVPIMNLQKNELRMLRFK
jgi:DNA polymerase II small subunit